MSDWIIRVENLHKAFVLHTQGGASIPVLDGFGLELAPGESAALVGPSGAGKSTVLKLLYGNYRAGRGSVRVRHGDGTVDVAAAEPHTVLAVRKWTVGYVSQFLRVIPRVPALQVVMEPLKERGTPEPEARTRAERLLERLRIPKRLWSLSPTTFSGGEQQRINIARGFVAAYPVLLLDEPTASLDPANRDTVVELIREARDSGSAVLGIYHDERVRTAVASRFIELSVTNGGV